MKNWLLALALLVFVLIPAVRAQEPPPTPDGRQHSLRDEVLEQMAGRWSLSGTIRVQERRTFRRGAVGAAKRGAPSVPSYVSIEFA